MAAYGSAISRYYVHYRAQSYIYKEKDINTKNSSAMVEYAQIKAGLQTKSLKSSISKNKKKKYLNAINALMGRKNNLSNEQKAQADQWYKELENMVISKNQDLLINRLSGAVSSMKQSQDKPSFQLPPQSVAMSKESADDFIQKFNKLTNYLSSAIRNGTIEWKDSAFEGTLNDLEALTAKLVQDYEQTKLIASQSLGKEAPQFFRNLTKAEKLKTKSWLLLDDTWRYYIKTFNELAQAYNFVFDAATLAQGTHFENVLAASAELVFGVGTLSIVDKIQEMVVGSDKVNAEFLMDGVSPEVWKQLTIASGKNDYSTTKKGVKTYIKKDYSQGKVDVTLEYDKGILNRAAKPVNISAKSIQGLSEIGIVSKTTADAIIDREENNYKKMYLNIMADRSDAIDNIFGISPGDNRYYSLAKAESAALNILQSQRKEAILSFKILAAYKALTGDVLGRSTAELFIVNDVTTQQVYLIEMTDIIAAILKEIQLDATKISKFFKIQSQPDFSTLRYLNDWVAGENGKEQRIANLLNNVHEHKIQVALHGSSAWFKSIGMSINSNGKITAH